MKKDKYFDIQMNKIISDIKNDPIIKDKVEKVKVKKNGK